MPGFSDDVRKELLKVIPEKACCLQSELNALTQGYGSIILKGGGRFQVRYRLPDGDTARMVFQLLKRRLGLTPMISFHQERQLLKRRLIDLTVGELDARRLLLALHMFDPKTGSVILHHVPRGTRTRRCCRRAFLRGAFIACGHVRSPEKTYRLEFAVENEKRAEILDTLLRQSEIVPRIRQRLQEQIVYVERGDEVSELLTLMGAHQALFQFENIRIRRAATGTANRQTNCDTANTARLLNAAQEQYDRLKAYQQTQGLDALPPRLREAAALRLEHPSASLQEIGSLCRPPVGKAAVSLRFRQLWERIGNNEESQ